MNLTGLGTTLMAITATTGLSLGVASADENPPPVPATSSDVPAPPSAPGNAYALGGAHVSSVPYAEYTMRAGEHWFPGRERQSVDYPAGQVQGHTLARLFPGIEQLNDVFPGLAVDGVSVGESVDIGAPDTIEAISAGGPGTAIGLSEGAMVLNEVQARLAADPAAPPPDDLSFAMFGDPVARHGFGESFLTQFFPDGAVVPSLDYRVPPPVESQYDTHLYVSAYDGIADWPDRPENWISVANAIVGLASGHTAVAFTDPSMVPPQNIKTTVNSRGATTTTYLIPGEHLPLVLPFKYLGVPDETLAELDAVLKPFVDAGYSRHDDPTTAPTTVDRQHGLDPAEVTPTSGDAPGGSSDLLAELASALASVARWAADK